MKSLDLKKLEEKLDLALAETLTKFLTDKTMSNNKQSTTKGLLKIMSLIGAIVLNTLLLLNI